MKNQPLLVSIVIGIIVIFVIVGASLVAKLSNVTKRYKDEIVRAMNLEKECEQLRSLTTQLKDENAGLSGDKTSLEATVENLKTEVATLTVEIDKLKKIKEVFEKTLTEEVTVQTTDTMER